MLPIRLFDSMLEDMNYDEKMKCDIYEKDNKYYVEMDIPGFDKNEISIQYRNNNLIITASKNEEEKDDKKYVCKERKTHSMYQRSIYLGDIDEEKIDASFKNGILRINVPKLASENKMIEIK